MITRYLRTVTDDVRHWNANLKDLQWILNSQINKTNGCSPNDAVFRFKPRDGLRNKVLAVLQEADDDMEVDEEATGLQDIAARADAEKAKWKARFDAKHRVPTQYREGDLVLIENVAPATGDSRKLEPKYRGPYVVKKTLDCDRYLVGDMEDAPRTQRPFLSVFTTEKMKPWCTLGPEAGDDEEDEQDDGEMNDEEDASRGRPAISGLAEL